MSKFSHYGKITFLSFLFFVIGLCIGFMPILEFVRTGFVYRQPSAILATGLMILSLMWFAIGVILDSVVRFHRFNYELRLQKRTDKT